MDGGRHFSHSRPRTEDRGATLHLAHQSQERHTACRLQQQKRDRPQQPELFESLVLPSGANKRLHSREHPRKVTICGFRMRPERAPVSNAQMPDSMLGDKE